ncbi:UNVERIFIED_CONTAM: Inositol oxygenase 4 [Sesamum latifolium]|uniref:Inositol oxygenase n=1 Tax=Sesamum latifolium TaxID=2727402 RepID=A0AAW2VFC0_9LAMI
MQVEEVKVESKGAFEAPEINAFGQTFRDYTNVESERQKSVEEFYRLNHISQSVDFVSEEDEGRIQKIQQDRMSIWECCELLNQVVDESDPDLDEPQIQHLLQSAEAARKDYPNEDWLHLTALIHDLGKVLCLPSFGGLPQWAVVGDTFPVGCAFDESIVHHKYFKDNSDINNPAYNTKNGIYQEGCGLDKVLMSWGHDEYMYLSFKENSDFNNPAYNTKNGIYQKDVDLTRFSCHGATTNTCTWYLRKTNQPYLQLHCSSSVSTHSIAGAYTHLMNEEDKKNLEWLKKFNKYDLYSKSKVRIDVDKVKPYYLSLIEKD